MKIYDKQNIPWRSSEKKGDKQNDQGNSYVSVIGSKKKLKEIQQKEKQQQKDKGDSSPYTYAEANRKFGWESSKSSSSGTVSNTSEQNINVQNTGEKFNVSNRTTSIFTNTASTAGVDKVVYVNPYLAAANKVKKVLDRGRMFITENLEKESLQSERKQTMKGFDSLTGFVVAFATLIISILVFLSVTVIPIGVPISVIVSGAEYFSSRDTAIVSVAQMEYVTAEENIGGEKYKQWYGINGDWCAMFVSWCSNQCNYISQGMMPMSASVANMASWYQQAGLWMSQESGYEPQPGDIIFFQEGMSHVGIVVAYDSDRKIITTIEGNTGISITEIYHEGSRVECKYYPLTFIKITGYGIPQYSKTLFGALEN